MTLRRREPLSVYWIIVILIPVSIAALVVVVNIFGITTMAEDEIEVGDTVTRVARGAHWTVLSFDDLVGSTVYRLKSQLSGRHETVLVPRGSDRSTYLQLHTKASGTNREVEGER